MRKTVYVLLLVSTIYFTANAKTFYFSASGNDANNGTSTSTAWQTLSKFNAVFSSLSPGDNVLFKRGDVFYGSTTISRSGLSGSPITIGAYGTGAMPVITGLTTVSAWTNLGSNIWESTNAVSGVKYTNMVVVNGVNTPMGRYPNTGYLSYQTHGTNSITSSSLTGSPNWTGAEAGISNTPFNIIRCPITSQSGGTLNYTNNKTIPDTLFNTINSFFLGNFIIQNDPRTLDTINEWYYNPSTKKIRIYNTVSPANVQVSAIDTLVYMNGRSYITFDGISFQGANSSAIEGINSPHIVVKNCDFNFSGKNGIHGSLNNMKVESCTMNHTNSNAIDLVSSTPDTIRLCTITNTGMIVMAMQDGPSKAEAITTRGDNEIIEYNNIDSTGFCGIRFLGSNIIIQNNFVNHSCMILYDAGSIYTFNSGSLTRSGTKILNNIVLNTPAKNGALDIDDRSNGILIQGNTTAFTTMSIYLHNSWNIQVLNNTTYSNDYGIMSNWNDTTITQNNLTIKNNIFFAKTSTQKTGNYYTEYVATMPLPFTADSNYYARPIDDNLTIQTVLWPSTVVQRTLAGWATLNTQEAHSHKSPITITDVNDLRFEYNVTSSNKTVSLAGNYIDVKNVAYNGGITLAPYTSAVLIKNGAATNQSPTANAGSNQTITLPTNTVSLSGSGTDPDGTIASYNWTRISGPSSGTIINTASASTMVTGLVQGVYQFELGVTDNNGATGLATVQVTVNPAANIAPTANAGTDQLIILPTTTGTLIGNGTDPDGSISIYNWTKISGPASGTITNAASTTTSVTGLVQGVYQFELNVTDNNGATGLDTVQVTVNAANIPPTANAGNDNTITLPTNTVSLSGSGTDTDGSISIYNWTKISGPSGGTITNPASAATSVTGLVQGVYQFELNVTDNNGATGLDTVQVTVNAANIPPTANAGNDNTITLPTNTVSLSGSGTDTDGSISIYNWTKISGPSGGTITNPASAATSVTGLMQGVYQFQLTVTDNDGATDLATVQVTVNAANIAPTANAGNGQSITLPTNTVSLSGSGTDADGNISAYSWTKVSGPSGCTITNPASAATSVTGLMQGVYQFQLTVTDNDGATDLATVQVTVNAANIAPTANAGSGQSITLPTNTVSLSGSGTDTDGNISAYSWTKVSGPSGCTITNPASAATSVAGLVQGVYQFQLTVTDNDSATDLATVQVTVNAANIAPTANAGNGQSITLPTNTVSLSGSGTDTDGNISAYSWTKVSGPSGCTITNPASAATSVTGLVQGVYQFQLTVTDNDGATDLATVQVTVNAANIAPTANAGNGQSITLPTNTVSLSGSGTDTDGNISAYSWTKVSGPSGCTITNPASAATSVAGLVQGVYQFQLTVTDNDGATDLATVQVTVNAANIAPTANAGNGQSITLPTNTVSLSGSGTDTDGSISAYSWTKVSGPSGCTITTPASAATSVAGLVQGVYQFQLTVTDNDGATDVATVQVTVNGANIVPTANAGPDQSITLPTSTVTLSGSGTDTDGSISAYQWSKVLGPVAGTITNIALASTTVTGLVQGVYQFQLTVTDNDGATDVATVQVTVNAANIAPTANAGPDQSITLPTSTVTLSGSGTDTDGSISAYQWSKVSGPSAGTITNIALASTTATGLVQGVYQFQLTVTDNDGATDVATVQVTVNASNIAPTANAGPDQSITLPTSTVTLSGSGTDTDGSISAYQWSKVSGPSAGTITNIALASTTATGLVQGVYQFQLTVTDNDGATDVATVQVTVNASNIAPTANAGPDQSITLPTSTVTLSGSGTDTDGSISAYQWSKVSGPSAGTITNIALASTTATGLVQGVYQFQLTVTDNDGATDVATVQVTVNAANIAPTANAGIDQTITLPSSTVTLSGSGTDPDGTISAYNWTKVAGPAGGTITSTTSASTTVTALVQGVYKFQLKVTDNNSGMGVDTVQVTVNAANIVPTANAGIDQTITLPTSTVTLSGSGTDPDGTISAYNWTKVAGPAGGTITSTTSTSTTVTALVQGVYKFQLKVTDNNSGTGVDTVQVTVNAANIAPTANAGIDQTIALPSSTVTLSGSGTDPDGTISAYSWTKVAGPAGGTITSTTSASTTVTSLGQGVYKFQLKVTDNNSAAGFDTIQVTVNPSNIPPTANAGTDQTITLPTSTVTLSGSGTDPDGTISAFNWTKISGPASGTIISANSASATAKSLVQGVYKFQLKVTDNRSATGLDTLQVTVNPANIPPTAHAGIDQTITLPTSTVTLSGSGTDPDGTISTYNWTKISGPTTGTITNATSASTTLTGLVQGVYKFQLKVTDNRSATGLDTVQVTVNAANIPPTANAGIDKTIILPTSSVTLSGSGTDPDGTISTYSWTKISGPASGTITSATSASTTVTPLVQGVYKFQLKVTDNNGAIGLDTIQVTVNAANIPPTAFAGADQTIILPTSTVTLSGSGTDPDGTISAYNWTKISGPASGKINSANSASTTVRSLVQGVYKFQLAATDNTGAIGRDTMQVTVNPTALSRNSLAFTGEPAGDEVSLTWETTNERNVSEFEVEKMKANTWEKIGNIQSTGGSLAFNDYFFSDYLPVTGLNYYRLKIVGVEGKFVYSDIIKVELKTNNGVVYQNVPNPFSDITNIRYKVFNTAVVKIIISNSEGIQVAVLVNEMKQPGVHQVHWNAGNIPSGQYFYTISIGNYIRTKKMLKIN